MTEKHVNEPTLALKSLVEFLNLSDQDVDELKNKLRRSEKFEHRWLYYSIPREHQKFILLRDALRENIQKLLKPAKNRSKLLLSAFEAIDQWRSATHHREILPLRRAERRSEPFTVIKIAGKSLALIEHVYDRPEGAVLWHTLDIALREGTFSLVRRCPVCEKFFLAKDPRDVYCEKRCAYRRRLPYFREKMKERRKKVAEEKQKEKARKVALERPQEYVKRLIRAEELDQSGQFLHIYKSLGGPIPGRRFIRELKGKSWREIDDATKKKFIQLSKTHPLFSPAKSKP